MKAINLAYEMLSDHGPEVPAGPLSIAPDPLATGRAGQPYRVPLQAVGGARPYRWEATLPPGLTLDPVRDDRGPAREDGKLSVHADRHRPRRPDRATRLRPARRADAAADHDRRPAERHDRRSLRSGHRGRGRSRAAVLVGRAAARPAARRRVAVRHAARAERQPDGPRARPRLGAPAGGARAHPGRAATHGGRRRHAVDAGTARGRAPRAARGQPRGPDRCPRHPRADRHARTPPRASPPRTGGDRRRRPRRGRRRPPVTHRWRPFSPSRWSTCSHPRCSPPRGRPSSSACRIGLAAAIPSALVADGWARYPVCVRQRWQPEGETFI